MSDACLFLQANADVCFDVFINWWVISDLSMEYYDWGNYHGVFRCINTLEFDFVVVVFFFFFF
jgi:hypothetical protein